MNESKARVIVIGAGISGLAAARQLSGKLNCMIIEASNRIGGRIKTDYFQDVPIELGAFVIHGTQNNPIINIAEQIGLEKKFIEDNVDILDEYGEVVSTDTFCQFDRAYSEICDEASKFSFSADEDMTLFEAIQIVKRKNEAIPDIFTIWKNKMLSAYFGMNIQELSARFYSQEQILPGGNHLVLGGYENVVKGLRCEDLDIKLNLFVTSIEYNGSVVRVATHDGQCFECEAVLVTVPLGVLKSKRLVFSPELPSIKSEAIQQMEMGLLNKVVLCYEECFWPKDVQRFGNSNPDSIIPIFFNYMAFVNKPILFGLTGGSENSARLENLEDDEVIKIICDELKVIFNREIPRPTKFFVTRWSKDPFCYGSYSCLRSGTLPEVYENLEAPVSEKIFFAGEATIKNFSATVHGAYLSGILASKKIMQKFGLEIQTSNDFDAMAKDYGAKRLLKI